MVAAEYEATQLYMQLAESTDNKLAVEVLKDIANEERVHAGEFLRLLRELSPDEEKFYAKGAAEVEEEIKKMTLAKPMHDLAGLSH
jgi:rubrerythrin